MKIITRKAIDRRTFLRGAGASVALPMLDAMLPAFAASGPTGATRLLCIEEVHGQAGCNEWGAKQFLFAPEKIGRDYQFAQANPLKQLEKWREQFTIVSNTDVRMAEPFSPSEVGGDHFRSSAVFLTQSHPKQTQGSDVSCGVSLDQLQARKFGRESLLPSLQLSIEPTDKGGGCGYGYSCSYTDSISWASADEPLPMIRNPRTAFDMLFGAGGTAEERAVRRNTHASILDWVMEQSADLKASLGSVDRGRFDQYLDSVREIERRIQMVEARNSSGLVRELPGAPPGVPDSFSEHMKLMYDLQVLAFQTDMTRVIAFKTGRDASSRSFPESGSDKAFHPASHHGGNEDSIKEFNRICQYRVGQMAYLLDKLENTTDGGGSLLDQTLIVWGSPMGDANLHNHRRCPLVVFGGGNGIHSGGSHIKAPDGTPMANAMLYLLNALGHDLERFGDSTGELRI